MAPLEKFGAVSFGLVYAFEELGGLESFVELPELARLHAVASQAQFLERRGGVIAQYGVGGEKDRLWRVQRFLGVYESHRFLYHADHRHAGLLRLVLQCCLEGGAFHEGLLGAALKDSRCG